MKEIVILTGPNGAGKTTAARRLLPKFSSIQDFLNADEFARAIFPQDSESAAFAAGRRMLMRMRELIARNQSFGFESTLSEDPICAFCEDVSNLAGESHCFIFGCPLLRQRSSALPEEFKRVVTDSHPR